MSAMKPEVTVCHTRLLKWSAKHLPQKMISKQINSIREKKTRGHDLFPKHLSMSRCIPMTFPSVQFTSTKVNRT